VLEGHPVPEPGPAIGIRQGVNNAAPVMATSPPIAALWSYAISALLGSRSFND
jgi:hypothetical protein